MGVYTQLPDDLEKVDVIIAGGGTAGCIVAARLSEADPSLSVLVIEGGENNDNVMSITRPVLFLGALMPTNSATQFYTGNEEPQLGNRRLTVPTGGVLGGGSSINLMMYSRAQRHDWNSWKAPGWSADEMIPYLKKLEHYYGPGTEGVHGDRGPIAVSGGTYRANKSQDDFISAAAQVGYPEYLDLQDLDSNNGVQRAQRFIGPDGLRSDTAHAYVHPKLEGGAYPNLHLLVQTQVVRVLFNGKKATGVEFRGNPKFQNDTTVRSIKAEKMVVISAGALGSPLLLERSGVGDSAILETAGVPLIAHVPGVGRNYQDHHLLSYAYKSSLLPNETVDAIYGGRVDVGELLQTNASILGWNAQDVTCKLRPNESDVVALGPDFQAAYDQDFKNTPDKPLTLMALLSGYPGDPTGIDPGQYLAVSTFTVYPYSRGHIHTNSFDLDDPPDFATGFFTDPLDVKKHIWSYKKQREIIRRMQTYRGEMAATHPTFPNDSAAALIEIDKPLTDVTDIQYTAEDDAIIEKWARENVGTTWHSLGTCNMAPFDQGGVVDATLSVYGVENLKIADLSIPPQNVAANTANTAMAIGERAADIFIQELGLGN
ncbi:alcohol dehydrogenase (GMC oxidoreductase) [Seiridium cupressi]